MGEAGSGSLPLSTQDSQGKIALDYLLGKGPVPANPKLAGDGLTRAERLLAP